MDNLLSVGAEKAGLSFTHSLVSRMTGKLVQTYATDITDLIIDDLLTEMVFILNQCDEIKE